MKKEIESKYLITLILCIEHQAMHLVYKVLDNYPLPVSLPQELLQLPGGAAEPSVRRGSTLAGSVNVLPSSPPPDNLKTVG